MIIEISIDTYVVYVTIYVPAGIALRMLIENSVTALLTIVVEAMSDTAWDIG